VDHLRASFRACASSTYSTLGGTPFLFSLHLSAARSQDQVKLKAGGARRHGALPGFARGRSRHPERKSREDTEEGSWSEDPRSITQWTLKLSISAISARSRYHSKARLTRPSISAILAASGLARTLQQPLPLPRSVRVLLERCPSSRISKVTFGMAPGQPGRGACCRKWALPESAAE
jgi:hypothetical protein